MTLVFAYENNSSIRFNVLSVLRGKFNTPSCYLEYSKTLTYCNVARVYRKKNGAMVTIDYIWMLAAVDVLFSATLLLS